MPVIYKASAGGVPDSFAILIKPDWSAPVRLTYSIASEQSEGLTGIEYRTPAHRSIRILQEYAATMEEADAASLREALASMGSKRVAVPLWPDVYAASWMHAGQYTFSFSDAGAVVYHAGSTGPFTHPNNAPMLFGRLTGRPTIEQIGGDQYAVTIEIQEDSPFTLRIDPATGSTPSTFDFDPDYSTPIEDDSRDQLRPSQIGQGREVGMGGSNTTPRWGEQAGFTLDRTEAAELLRFWVAKRGACDAFTVPAWGLPGTATSTTPANYSARFDADALSLVFETPQVITTELKLWQQVTTGDAQSADGRGYIYAFTWEGGTTTRYTSWEHALTYSSNSYAPTRIGKAELRKTMQPLGDECDIEIWSEEPGNPLALILSGEAERKLVVTVGEVVVNSSGTVTSYAEIFTGTVQSVELKDDLLIGKAASYGGIFNRKLPPFLIQQGCNYSLFAGGTCKLSAAAWDVTGTIGGTLPGTEPTFTPGAAPTGAYADKWFAGGWLTVTGTDSSENRRAILDCSVSMGVWTLKINRPLPATCSGQTATAYPGCDGNYTTCKDKFGNGLNFGGHPYAPSFIATSSGNGATQKAK